MGLLAFGFTRNPADLPSALLGLEAPDFDLAVMPMYARLEEAGSAGATERARLSSLAGSPVVVNFWASWCLACRAEHAALSEAADGHRHRGVHFFGVLYQDTPPNARRWIDEMGGQSYPTLLDPGSRTAIQYGVYGVPETFFIDRAGRVVHRHLGPVTPAVLASWVSLLLEGPLATGTQRTDPGEP